MKRLSPQEKKQLSYAKDRRNTYGENDKASRTNIPRSKRNAQQANRHRTRQVLSAALGAPDEAVESAVESRIGVKRPLFWRKCPDTPLGEYLEYRLGRRAEQGISAPDTAQARIERIQRRGRVQRAWR